MPGGGEPRFSYSFYIPELEANQSITCEGLYRIEFSEGVRTVDWNVGVINDTDPDRSNNSVRFVFGIRPTSVSMLSPTGVLILMLAFIIASILVFRN